jgi:hypothetical protein
MTDETHVAVKPARGRRKATITSSGGLPATAKPLLELFAADSYLLPSRVQPADLPDRYVLNMSEVMGWKIKDRLKPLFRCLYSSVEPVASGDIVLLFYRPELFGEYSSEKRYLIKHLTAPIPEGVTFPWREKPGPGAWPVLRYEELLTPDRFVVRCADILAIHKCLGPVPDGIETIPCRPYGRSLTIRSDATQDFWNARRAAQ